MITKLISYLKVCFATTLNIVLNGLTLGKYVWLEGRVKKGIFRNWARRFNYKPKNFFQPKTEEEIIQLIKSSQKLRVFGSGHSFNNGIVSEETLVSLDNYIGFISDEGENQVRVKGGTRVRDVVTILLAKKLAFKALPSHDAQSIAGILSTDVHGTGKEWGFVSDSVVSLKLIDGTGRTHQCNPSEDLFKAAIGGIGCVGIITEVVIQGVKRFNVAQKTEIADLAFIKSNLHKLLESNDHLSFYLFPFTDKCQINSWNITDSNQSYLGNLREFVSISVDALLAAWAGNLLAYTGLLPYLSTLAHSLKKGSNLILESHEAFNRTIYYLHQELEFTVPFEDTFEVCDKFIKLYEKMYRENTLPYALFEVRFTPDKHDRTLIGAGRDRRCTWIDLVLNDSEGVELYYAEAEKLIKQINARPHLGKYCISFTKADMAKIHEESFTHFLNLLEDYDPQRKFSNDFTKRIFNR